MFISAEMRWFWPDHCPQQVHEWFFKTGLGPGGGRSRIDRYLSLPNNAELGIKTRGDAPGLEIKGLVATRGEAALAAVAPHLEIWCKWFCPTSGLKLTDEMTVTKTRWLRQFDTSKPAHVEIPLDENERPKTGEAWLAQGCNVELTQVSLSGRRDVWWTLGFEAFGGLDTVAVSLTRVVLPESSILAGLVLTGMLLSYPAWLQARLADGTHAAQ